MAKFHYKSAGGMNIDNGYKALCGLCSALYNGKIDIEAGHKEILCLVI